MTEKNGIPYGSIPCGDTAIFTDIPAAIVMEDGSICRTLNGQPMKPGTRLFVVYPPEENNDRAG